MANKQVVTVKELTKYGCKDQDGFLNWSQKLPESERGKVVPGGSYEFDIYTSDKGVRYVNSVKLLSIATSAPKERVKEAVKPAAKTEVSTAVDWAAKDRSQLIGGLSHDAAAIASALVTCNGADAKEALEIYKGLLVGMLKIRGEVK